MVQNIQRNGTLIIIHLFYFSMPLIWDSGLDLVGRSELNDIFNQDTQWHLDGNVSNGSLNLHHIHVVKQLQVFVLIPIPVFPTRLNKNIFPGGMYLSPKFHATHISIYHVYLFCWILYQLQIMRCIHILYSDKFHYTAWRIHPKWIYHTNFNVTFSSTIVASKMCYCHCVSLSIIDYT